MGDLLHVGALAAPGEIVLNALGRLHCHKRLMSSVCAGFRTWWLKSRCAQRARIGAVVSVLGSIGCRGDALRPTGPSDPGSGCGLAPMPLNACTTVTPRCPQPRPEGAQPLISIATCLFRGREAGCEPGPILPGCPRRSWGPIMTLVNPSRDALHPCVAGGELHLAVTATAVGGATISWEGSEWDSVTCRVVGPEITGSTSIDGPCCEKTIDVHYPAGDFTVRFVIRTDWQP